MKEYAFAILFSKRRIKKTTNFQNKESESKACFVPDQVNIYQSVFLIEKRLGKKSQKKENQYNQTSKENNMQNIQMSFIHYPYEQSLNNILTKYKQHIDKLSIIYQIKRNIIQCKRLPQSDK